MAALTWRNVDGPDFRGINEGFRNFSDLLGNAFSGLERGLDRFDSSQDERANKAIMAAALQERDPTKFNERLASGEFLRGVDSRRLSSQTLAALDNRPTTLLEQATSSDNLEWTRNRRAKTTNEENALKSAAPLIAEIAQANLSGDPVKIKAAYDKNGAAIAASGLDVNQLLKVYSDTQNLEKGSIENTGGRLRNTGTGISNDTSKMNYNNALEDRNREEAAITLAERLTQQGGNASNFDLLLPNGTDPIVAARVRGIMGVGSPAGGAIAGALGGGSGTTGDPTRIMNYEARAAGFGSVPDSVKTLGQASDYAQEINRAGVASSAMGTYQIVGQTLRNYAPRVLGKDWRNVEFNQANQDKIAKAIFDDHKGSASALSKQWVSLSASEAEQVRKMPWEQARQIIAGKESGASPAQLAITGAVQQYGASSDVMRNNAGSIAPVIQEAMLDVKATPVTAAAGLKKTFPDLSTGQLVGQINGVIAQARKEGVTLNPAAAAAMLAKNVEQTGWVGQTFGRIGANPYSMGSGLSRDDTGIAADIASLKNGGAADVIAANAGTTIDQATIGSAKAMYDQARAQATAARQAAANNPRYNPVLLQRALQAEALAGQQYQAVLGASGDRLNARGAFGSSVVPEAPPMVRKSQGKPSVGPTGASSIISNAVRGNITPVDPRPAPSRRAPTPAPRRLSDQDWGNVIRNNPSLFR